VDYPVVTFENLVTNSRSVFVCLIFPWNFGRCSNTQNTPLVTALTGSTSSVQLVCCERGLTLPTRTVLPSIFLLHLAARSLAAPPPSLSVYLRDYFRPIDRAPMIRFPTAIFFIDAVIYRRSDSNDCSDSPHGAVNLETGAGRQTDWLGVVKSIKSNQIWLLQRLTDRNLVTTC